MDDKELISVIVPVYRVMEYLDRCMQSIMAQTYQNLEILLVDDGSPDESGKMCDGYAKRDSRIKVIHKENGGLSSARNAALEVAQGSYIGFVDSDDYISHRMFEKLYEAAKTYQAEVVVCGHFTEQDGRISIQEPILDDTRIYSAKEALTVLVEDVEMNNYAWDKLYKAELFQKVRYPNGRNYEDIATTYLLFDQAERIVQIPEYLYYYQLREGSISSHKDELKWYRNCCQIIDSYVERFTYFGERGYQEIEEAAFAKTVPYFYEAVKRAHQFQDAKMIQKMEALLSQNKEKILSNSKVSAKDKKVYPYYSNTKRFVHYQKLQRTGRGIRSLKNHIRNHMHADYDFSLKEGKTIRYVMFELPCFDNLGDHAIAFAQMKILKKLAEKNDQIQIFQVDGWDTPRAVRSLKKVIGFKDVIFCQGGGNFGNLYDFAQIFRKLIFTSFSKFKICIFPQTMYFSEDEAGRKSLYETEKLISKCSDLTMVARDHKSYELMKAAFATPNIIEMPDVVSFMDASEYSSENREGILFCIRSDQEGTLSAAEHTKLLHTCEKLSDNVKVSDTCEKIDISLEMREDRLQHKWRLFGKHRLVVTDRLHGMIFSLITQTPCIVLGNNHHKVKETYRIFKECEYLYFAESIEEAILLIEKVYDQKLPSKAFQIGSMEEWSKLL